MKKGWFILLTLSLGLNAGLLIVHFAGPMTHRFTPHSFSHNAGHRAGGRQGGGHAGWQDRIHPVLNRVMEHRMGRMADRMGLERSQRDELSMVLQSMIPLILEAKENVAIARESIREEYLTDNVDPLAVRTAVANLSLEQARLDSLVAEAMLQESVLLTREQRERYMRSMPWERHTRQGGGGGSPRHRNRGESSKGGGEGRQTGRPEGE